jgi:hypothetical protein
MDQLRAQCDLLLSLAGARAPEDVRTACDAVARAVTALRAAPAAGTGVDLQRALAARAVARNPAGIEQGVADGGVVVQ